MKRFYAYSKTYKEILSSDSIKKETEKMYILENGTCYKTKYNKNILGKLYGNYFFAVAENKEEFLVLLKQALETRVKEYQQKIFDTEEQIQHLQCLKEKREDEK